MATLASFGNGTGTYGLPTYDRTVNGEEFWTVGGTDIFKVYASDGSIGNVGDVIWQDLANVLPTKFNITATTTNPQSITAGNGDPINIQSHDGHYMHQFDASLNYYGYTQITLLASSGPTVTSITVNEPALGPYTTGMGGSFYIDGQVISNDTIVASDFTLYKDFVSYPNSNITMHSNNEFELTKTGTGLYIIQCGDKHASIYYQDESWLSTITSSSSSRSTNSIRIRDMIARIPENIEIKINKLYDTPVSTGMPNARGPDQTGWISLNEIVNQQFFTIEKNITHSSVSYKMKYNNGDYWIPEPFTLTYVFELGEINNEICWRYKKYQWFQDLSLNHALVDTLIEGRWYEVGAHPHTIWSWTWDQNSTRHGHPNYDSWLVDEHVFLSASSWLYYAEPEGDDQGPDGNPPYNTPPGENMPNDPPDDPDPPKHQYPGDKYRTRRRAHSFW